MLSVVAHGSVHEAVGFVGESFEVGVVGIHHARRARLGEVFQNGFGNGSAQTWFGACSKFVNQKQCFSIGKVQKILHVGQVTAVRTEVIVKALLVADVNKQVLENTHRRAFEHRHQKPTLVHVLQQPNGF